MNHDGLQWTYQAAQCLIFGNLLVLDHCYLAVVVADVILVDGCNRNLTTNVMG